MRLWSLHPKYLDSKGLVALWRETLLAKAVLEGKTSGYTHHPQLIRFRESGKPIDRINEYLTHIYIEAANRSFSFDRKKIGAFSESLSLEVTDKQINYEYAHLLKKLEIRDPIQYKLVSSKRNIEPHPLFKLIPGEIEKWEVVKHIF